LADAAALRRLLARSRPELVLNAAAYTAVDKAESETERAFAVNAHGPAVLAAWCQEQGAAVIHVSTDYVFDGNQSRPYTEDDATNPQNVYGASKLKGELELRTKLERHVVLRTSWVFSAHGHNFVKTILRLASERPELRVVDDQRGRPTPAADLARAMLSLAEQLAQTRELAWGTYHFAGAGATTWHGFAKAILEARYPAASSRPKLTAITSAEFPTPAPRPGNSVLDTSRFEHVFGIAIAPWRDGLRSVVDELNSAGR
jgi:dTDP-4-dehydrorhamnose reductase